MTDGTETFQLSDAAAEAYEAVFVPALFAEWADRLVDLADIAPGHAVLDVACGTGVVARTASDRLAGEGRVAGVDLNEGMLAVARRLRPDLEWHQGDATDLPFPDGSFDRVLCQAALMYFPDRVGALAEMGRVATGDGVLAIQVWGALAAQPAYQIFADIAARHAGDRATQLVSSYFCLGDLDALTDLFRRAGLAEPTARTVTGTVRFGSIEEFVHGEVDGSPLADHLDADGYQRLLADCRDALGHFVAADGRTQLPIVGHLLTAHAA